MIEAYNILNRCIRYTKQMQYFNDSEEVGLSPESGGSGGNGNKNNTCWRCKKKYTSVPNALFGMIMVLPVQEKIIIATIIIRELLMASK